VMRHRLSSCPRSAGVVIGSSRSRRRHRMTGNRSRKVKNLDLTAGRGGATVAW
jgi:hypothetical protein